MDQQQQDANDIVNELNAQFGDTMATIQPRTGNVQPPKGKYAFVSTNAYINRSSGQSNRKQIVMTAEIKESSVGDEWIGKSFVKTWGLESAENMEWLLGDLQSLEIEVPKNAQDLLRVVNQLIGVGFQGMVTPNKQEEFPPNLYLNRGARRRDLEAAGSQKQVF